MRSLTGIAIVFFATTAAAQDSLTRSAAIYEPRVPARSVLALREELHLSDAQVSRLKTLEALQVASLGRATAAFLRAEADLLDANRGEDIVLRRAALEKRSRIAIDGEIARLQAEKDSRAVLTADQRAKLVSVSPEPSTMSNDVAVWQSIVAPPPLSRIVRRADTADSVEVRMAVLPNYADIYLNGMKIGTGRKFVMLPVGRHELLYHAPGCTDIKLQITVEKGPPLLIPVQTLACIR